MNTLEAWLPSILENPDEDVNNKIYNYLSDVNTIRLKDVFNRISVVRNYKIKEKGKKGKEKQGRRSRLIGKLFEELIKCLFQNSRAFGVITNIRTTTSEIDFLIGILPVGKLVPFLSKTSTHMIGEAKFYKDAPKTEWVNELIGLLQTHSSEMAILFLGCSSRILHRDIRQSIALHVQNQKYVIHFGQTQIEEVLNGGNFIRILEKQYLLASTHSSQIQI